MYCIYVARKEKFGANLINMMRNTAIYDEKNLGQKAFLSPQGWGTSGYPVFQTLPVSTPWESQNMFLKGQHKTWLLQPDFEKRKAC